MSGVHDADLERVFANGITVLHWADQLRVVETYDPQTGALIEILTVTAEGEGVGVAVATGIAWI